jgi:hypothetical protein
MKQLIYTFPILIAAACSFAQVAPSHEWNVTITVADEARQPVPDANVKVIFSTFTPKDERVSTNISGQSGSEGVFHASSVYTGDPAMLVRAAKPGFYATSKPYDLGDYYSVGRWNPEMRLVLKKIGNPASMYAKRIDSYPPATGKQVGFDLTVGDWAATYGAGQTSDLIFQMQSTRRSPLDYEGTITITFSNQGDGIQEYSAIADESGSELRSPREAPASGYLPKLDRVNISHPPEPAKWDYDPNRQYFFRVRTVLDEQGNVKSALYGKIYGDFMEFTYYLNPTPNDRNVEFDPNHNLLPNQRVTAP